MLIYTCEYCGRGMEVNFPSQRKRFCSHACANKWRWEHTEKKRIHLVCIECGKVFDVIPSDHRLKGAGIKYCSKECASKGLQTGEIKTCEFCGKEFYTTRHRFCSKTCANEHRSANAPGKIYTENGYNVIHKRGYNKKGNAKEHVLIMEDYIGRRLMPNECVHHINGIKNDNRIENLVLMLRKDHSRYHRMKDKEDGKSFFTKTQGENK